MTGPDLLPASTSVSTEAAQFLAQLAVGMHKLRAYPVGHPMRLAAVSAAYRSLLELQRETSLLRVGVARTQLLVGDGATDPDHFIIGDLAARLHRRQVGSIAFRTGVSEAEFTAVLETLAIESPRQRGVIDEPVTSPSEMIEITPIAFDALVLQEEEGGVNQVDRLWQELAGLVAGATGYEGGLGGSGTGGGQGEGTGSGGDGYARAVVERLRSPEVRNAFLTTLERLGRLSQNLEGEERAKVEARLGDLLATLPRDAISMLLDIDVGRREGLKNMLPAVEWLPTVALVELIESAARAQKGGISAVMLRLLRKLAGQGRHAAARRSGSDRDLRAMVKGLLEDWSLNDPNSKSHAHILETLARQESISLSDGATTSEGLRILKIAVETEAVGEMVLEAVEMVIASRQLDELLALLVEAPEPNRAVREVRRLLGAPAQVRRIFGDPDLDPAIARQLLPHVDEGSLTLLVERLLSYRDEAVRRDVVDRVLRFGPAASAAVLQRLERSAGEERRQLLQLLQSANVLPTGFDPRAYAMAPEPMVRLEAIRLMLNRAADRDDAIHLALADDDERVVELALDAGVEDMPRQSLTRVMLLLNSPRRSMSIKAKAVPVLAHFDVPSIREWLLANLVVKKGWLRRRRLAAKTPLVVAKIQMLATKWADQPEAARVLELARSSGDPDLVRAATGATS